MSLWDTPNHEKNRRWVPGVNGVQPTKSFRDRKREAGKCAPLHPTVRGELCFELRKR